MKTTRAFSILFFALSCFITTEGQTSLFPKYEIGVSGGMFVYEGDLTPNPVGSFNTLKPGFGIFGTRNINRVFAIRLQLMRGWLKGDESKYEIPAWRQQRNFFFRTPVTELSALAVWNLMGLHTNEAGIINFSPYVFGGLGYSFLKIQRDWSRFNYTHFASEPSVINGLSEDINHGVPKGIFVIPVGLGVRYGINEKLSFSLEGTYRFTGTDYLDGFSKAANPDLRDHYHSLTFSLIYSFGKRNSFDCPVVK
jgi:hypothetical protein